MAKHRCYELSVSMLNSVICLAEHTHPLLLLEHVLDVPISLLFPYVEHANVGRGHQTSRPFCNSEVEETLNNQDGE